MKRSMRWGSQAVIGWASGRGVRVQLSNDRLRHSFGSESATGGFYGRAATAHAL